VLDRWQKLKAKGEAPFPALQQAIDAVFDARIGDISGRGKLAADMREIWMMQPRFERRVGNTPYTLVEQPRFRAGFDFLRLRADAGETDSVLAEWWEDFSMGDDDERRALIDVAKEQDHARRATGGGHSSSGSGAGSGSGPAVGESDPAKKRRRRRRKPGGGSQGGPSGPGAAPASSDS
jgi:poly(A) polymerase